MNYKYKRTQIFGKRLKVSKNTLNKIYDCTLPFEDYIQFRLDDKIPISCVAEADRKIIERFGIEKCKVLDWELINSIYNSDINIRDILMSINPQTENVNHTLYELVKDQIKPINYSMKMKEVYSDRLLDAKDASGELRFIINAFNSGEIGLKKILLNWDLLKDKDLSYCLLKDRGNKNHITDAMIKDFMSHYRNLVTIIIDNNVDIYAFIHTISTASREEKNHYLKQLADDILSDTYKEYKEYGSPIKLTNEQFQELFKYTSLEESLKLFYGGYLSEKFLQELRELPEDYLFNMPIPFSELLNLDVLSFIELYGLKNIVDFDNECGHFFTNNSCEMLELMNDMYLHYANNEYDPEKTIYTKKNMDQDGNIIDRPYTKDEFYEAMRRMIVYGPSDWNYAHKAPDYRQLKGEFRIRNKELFLPEQAPEELQKLFYTKSITPQILFEHPDYIQFLEGKDFSSCFEKREIQVEGSSSFYEYENFYKFISSKMDFNSFMVFIIKYRYVLDSIFDINNLYDSRLKFSVDDNLDQIQDKVNQSFIKIFVEKGLPFPKVIPQRMKDTYPVYFLPDEVPKDIQEKFYNREFTISDFASNSELFDLFEKTNIACGFPLDMNWIIPLFDDSENIQLANYKRMKVISAYSKIQDMELQKIFRDYVMDFKANIDIEKIEYASEVLSRLSLSNSCELFSFRRELALQLLRTENPLESLSKIEDVFIKNNIPTVGKIYSCFEILHPDFQGFDFEKSMISPVLKKSTTTYKKAIVFSDLIKSSFGSNNRSVNAYLKNIEFGSNLYERIKSGQISFDSLNEDEQEELITFCDHLETLYNHTVKAKKENKEFTSTGDVLTDILELSKRLSPDGSLDYNIADRVIKMFCGVADINTLEQAKEYIERKVAIADSRNRDAANSDMVLEKGDFIKGIGEIDYLGNILQNGSVSKEYLGSSACSDATPLDTDLSMIMSSGGTISEKINETAAKKYGPIWFVLKKDDRFITTRTNSETLEATRDNSKMEVFYTGVLGQDHYGIRTGFASSEINYILMDEYDPRVGLEIAMNGFYIPVVNKEGKIIFSPKDYDELREKMSGLSYFGENNYTLSDNIISDDTEEIVTQMEQMSKNDVQLNREIIKHIIQESVEELGLQLKTKIDGDLSEGSAELINTGSTGRGTNIPGKGDFDYIMRLDNKIISSPLNISKLNETILKKLGEEKCSGVKNNGNQLFIESFNMDDKTSLELQITYAKKTDKIEYSTEMAIQDKLSTIKKLYPEKYQYVVANIILAKKVLKDVYKPYQGGLGGVGIENWILQNGGSFIDASRSFIEAAEGKSFAEFQSSYQIWDFGDNHLAEKRGLYPHDNFVVTNMSEEGYHNMIQTLKTYLKKLETTRIETESIKR